MSTLARSRIAKYVASIASFGLLALVLFFACRGPLRVLYYERFRGADLQRIRSERSQALYAAWLRINAEISAANGMPLSQQQTVAINNDLLGILKTPKFSNVSYRVRWECIAFQGKAVLIDDPGIVWPPGSNKRKLVKDAVHNECFRVVLLNDGSIHARCDVPQTILDQKCK